ncbi:MAG: acylphosphatase [Candidatus Magnetoovum sp. WYHC-5]|nr:acylphosphatase [Candidatus Magnetoovum sp. WYHC-5]
METLKRVHLIIEGRVQGVYFRAFVKKNAIDLGVKGWVRNLPDGTVEVLLEGEKKALETLVGRCYKGPPASVVIHIQINWQPYVGEFSSFGVSY